MTLNDISISVVDGSLGQVNSDNMHIISKQQWVQDLSKQIVQFLQGNFHWIGIPVAIEGAQKARMSLLDYACGNGLASYDLSNQFNVSNRALLPWFSKIRGIDISDAMVQEYNKLASEQSISPDVVHAIQGDMKLPGEEISSEDFFDFDVTIISMALHHIEDPEKLLSQLLARLRPGGSLLVIDWTPEHYGIQEVISDHPAAPTMSLLGFDKDKILKVMSSSGFEEIEYSLYKERTSMGSEIGGERQMFFALGKRPVSDGSELRIH